jgi:hypothetical protein
MLTMLVFARALSGDPRCALAIAIVVAFFAWFEMDGIQ